MMMVVVVTGSRDYRNREAVCNELNHLRIESEVLYIVVGDCPTGADLYARDWVETWQYWNCDRTKVQMKEFKANWQRDCDENCHHTLRLRNDERYCPVAGNIRNQEMIDYAIELIAVDAVPLPWPADVVCKAFYRSGAQNRGTSDCVKRAKAAKIRVQKIWEGLV